MKPDDKFLKDLFAAAEPPAPPAALESRLLEAAAGREAAPRSTRARQESYFVLYVLTACAAAALLLVLALNRTGSKSAQDQNQPSFAGEEEPFSYRYACGIDHLLVYGPNGIRRFSRGEELPDLSNVGLTGLAGYTLVDVWPDLLVLRKGERRAYLDASGVLHEYKLFSEKPAASEGPADLDRALRLSPAMLVRRGQEILTGLNETSLRRIFFRSELLENALKYGAAVNPEFQCTAVGGVEKAEVTMSLPLEVPFGEVFRLFVNCASTRCVWIAYPWLADADEHENELWLVPEDSPLLRYESDAARADRFGAAGKEIAFFARAAGLHEAFYVSSQGFDPQAGYAQDWFGNLESMLAIDAGSFAMKPGAGRTEILNAPRYDSALVETLKLTTLGKLKFTDEPLSNVVTYMQSLAEVRILTLPGKPEEDQERGVNVHSNQAMSAMDFFARLQDDLNLVMIEAGGTASLVPPGDAGPMVRVFELLPLRLDGEAFSKKEIEDLLAGDSWVKKYCQAGNVKTSSLIREQNGRQYLVTDALPAMVAARMLDLLDAASCLSEKEYQVWKYDTDLPVRALQPPLRHRLSGWRVPTSTR